MGSFVLMDDDQELLTNNSVNYINIYDSKKKTLLVRLLFYLEREESSSNNLESFRLKNDPEESAKADYLIDYGKIDLVVDIKNMYMFKDLGNLEIELYWSKYKDSQQIERTDNFMFVNKKLEVKDLSWVWSNNFVLSPMIYLILKDEDNNI